MRQFFLAFAVVIHTTPVADPHFPHTAYAQNRIHFISAPSQRPHSQKRQVVQPTTRTLPRPLARQESHAYDKRVFAIANHIERRYNVPKHKAVRFATLAVKYEKPVFPKAEDIVAIISIESAFNAKAKSNLERDPARGLMQVRLGMWQDLIGTRNMAKEEHQIAVGSSILREYFEELGHRRAAVMAYNVGIGNYQRGVTNPKYLQRYQTELKYIVKAVNV